LGKIPIAGDGKRAEERPASRPAAAARGWSGVAEDLAQSQGALFPRALAGSTYEKGVRRGEARKINMKDKGVEWL